VSTGGLGFPTAENGTVGASYDGTLNVKGGNFNAYCNLYVGAGGAANPGGVIPYQGTGYLNVSSGNFYVGWNGSFLYIGSGRQSDTLGNRTRGIATVSGGNVSILQNSGVYVGNEGGIGKLTVSNADPNVATLIDMPQAYIGIGVAGNSTYNTAGRYYRERSQGTYIQNGGSAAVGGLILGAAHGDGLFELNGGTFAVFGDNESRIGVGGGRASPLGTGARCTGNGSLIVNNGYFQSNNSRTKFIIGRGNSDDGGANWGGGTGVFLINGGLVEFNRAGDTRDSSIEVGHNGNADYMTNSYGELNVQGGSLYVNKQITLAKNESSTGVFRVSKNAFVQVGWLACWFPNEPIPTTGVPIIIVDVTNSGNSVINVYQDLWLRGTMDVRTYGWRPKEGDQFKVIDLSTYESEITGDFDGIKSEITNGLPTGPGGTLAAFLGDPCASDPSYGVEGAGYYVIFQGYTAGDANGSHGVDGGDLAILGGNWGGSGKTWAQGDFTKDGSVDGGDLALIGGNWNWSKPPAPAPGEALPEPTTLALLALGATAFVRRRKT
jgi:hypothetical protein